MTQVRNQRGRFEKSPSQARLLEAVAHCHRRKQAPTYSRLRELTGLSYEQVKNMLFQLRKNYGVTRTRDLAREPLFPMDHVEHTNC